MEIKGLLTLVAWVCIMFIAGNSFWKNIGRYQTYKIILENCYDTIEKKGLMIDLFGVRAKLVKLIFIFILAVLELVYFYLYHSFL